MSSQTPWICVVALVATIALVALGCASPELPPARKGPPPAALSIALPSDGGQLVPVPLRNRQFTVLEAWAPSCEPCSVSVPDLVARSAEIEQAGGSLVLVALLADGETTERARGVLLSWGVDRPFLVDRGNVLQREAKITGLPATLVVASSGERRWTAPPGADARHVIRALGL
jgi:hypothetical protein